MLDRLALPTLPVLPGERVILRDSIESDVDDRGFRRELTDVRSGRSIDVLTRPETLHRASALHVLHALRTLVTASAAAAQNGPGGAER